MGGPFICTVSGIGLAAMMLVGFGIHSGIRQRADARLGCDKRQMTAYVVAGGAFCVDAEGRVYTVTNPVIPTQDDK